MAVYPVAVMTERTGPSAMEAWAATISNQNG